VARTGGAEGSPAADSRGRKRRQGGWSELHVRIAPRRTAPRSPNACGRLWLTVIIHRATPTYARP